MKRSQNLLLILIFLSSSLLFSACYGNSQIEEDGVFKCKSKDDCLPNFQCTALPQHPGEKYCVKPKINNGGNRCIDNDGDGYGSPLTPDSGFSDCDACTRAKKCTRATAEDCDDSDKSVHPGAIELCDGKDNNCNKKIDEEEEKSCTDYTQCQFEGSTPGLTAGCIKNKCVIKKGASQCITCQHGTPVAGPCP